MKKIALITYTFLFAFMGSLFANEVNIFSARHYDSDVQLYQKFTAIHIDWYFSWLKFLTIVKSASQTW